MNTYKADGFDEFLDLQPHPEEDDRDTKTVNLDESIPWQQGCFPRSWAAFLSQLQEFCEACGWEVERYGSVEDHLCTIFAHPEHLTDEIFAEQAFTDDDLPF